MADTKTVKTAYPAYKHCLVHISETNTGRYLIFGTVTPFDLEDKQFQSAHQAAQPTCQNLILTISQRQLRIRDTLSH